MKRLVMVENVTPQVVLGRIIWRLNNHEPGLVKKIKEHVIVEITAASKEDPEFIDKHREDMMVIIHIPASLTIIGDCVFWVFWNI